VIVPALLYAAAWALMITAMMLPTTLPLYATVERLASGRPDRGRLLWLLGLGYFAVWAAFGLVAHVLHAGLLMGIGRVPALALNPWAIGAVTLGVAGAFQFSRLKHRCLERCRSPLSFAIEHWRGRDQASQAFALGVHHGAFCVGCCWALMLLMFVVGAGSLGWMLLLAAVMATEKNLPWGRRLSAPLGIALLSGAALLVVHNL
jgi:predicted metal-binding membrane protein